MFDYTMNFKIKHTYSYPPNSVWWKQGYEVLAVQSIAVCKL